MTQEPDIQPKVPDAVSGEHLARICKQEPYCIGANKARRWEHTIRQDERGRVMDKVTEMIKRYDDCSPMYILQQIEDSVYQGTLTLSND